MNIKITKQEYDSIVINNALGNYVIGSHLYRTATSKSDLDTLTVYDSPFESDMYYPNYHQLQYDDETKNRQYIFTTRKQFYKNLFSGDSTINADVIMFHNNSEWLVGCGSVEEKLNVCRTFNIIKAFIGFAKRDIKYVNKGKNKLFHIERGLYCAECLMNNELPKIELFKTFGNKDLEELKLKEQELRSRCNEMFDKGELTMFPKEPIIQPINELEKKIIDANNIKEFKY